MRVVSFFFIGFAFFISSCSIDSTQEGKDYDVVVYGGTSAGVSAAIQAKRMGKTVVLVCPDKHLGGMTSGGLGWTDFGRKETVGGFALEFYQELKKHYDNPDAWLYQEASEYSRYRKDDKAMWVFEPHVAEQTFEKLIADAEVPVFRNQWLDREAGVKKDANQIISITMLSGETYKGRIFIDASYEGDLMAAAGISYATGREANEVYNETLNGIQKKRAISHQFEFPVSPYLIPDDPTSGLIPLVHDGNPGEDGEGDHRIQAYNFRMCLTTAPENSIPFPKPENYDATQYELLARYFAKGWRKVFNKFDPAPNWKTDVNNHGGFSTDNIGKNYNYPEGSYEERQIIIKQHEDYQKGFLWFLANDSRVPEEIQTEINRWGLSKDEFIDNGNWPHQIYVREARRMIGDFVMTELHLRGLKPTTKSIGMGSYNMDSHNVQRYVDEDGNVRNEGDIQINPGGPYQISYSSIIPKAEESTNLLVPVCLSSSHIAYGSIRMEPVFMVLGQSAATAASLAIDSEIAVQDVDYTKLKDLLVRDKQVLGLK